MLTKEDIEKLLQLKKEHSIYAVFADRDLLKKIVDLMHVWFKDIKVDKVVGIEGRGFILGSSVAYTLHAGFVVVRKAGNMYHSYVSSDVYQEGCTDYSGKTKILELEKHAKAIHKGDSVVIIDDWFEKGGQGKAAIKLVERAGGKVVGIGVLLDQMKDAVRDDFSKYNFHAVTRFQD